VEIWGKGRTDEIQVLETGAQKKKGWGRVDGGSHSQNESLWGEQGIWLPRAGSGAEHRQIVSKNEKKGKFPLLRATVN